MFKRIAIVTGFIAFFAAMAMILFYLEGKDNGVETTSVAAENTEVQNVIKTDEMHAYNAENLSVACSAEDGIFCAVEKVIKCTMKPDLESCNKNVVPAFVIADAEDMERPTEMSFRIVKIKPIPESSDISVYTESDCNAIWFGLCKGTVVYSLSPKDGGWAVNNIFALEQ
jgi:hypothetical protein